MAEVDTSSYPKATLPVQKSLLDQAQQYGELALQPGRLQQQQQQIQSGAITIDKQKLDLMNTKFKLMNDELSTLINDPKATKEQAANRLSTFAKTHGFGPEVVDHMIGELKASPNVQSFARNALVRGMSIQERLNGRGNVGLTDTGNDLLPTSTSQLDQTVRPIGAPISKGLPPSTVEYDENNQPRYRGQIPSGPPPGAVPVPGGFPSQYRTGGLPIAPVAPPMVNNPPGGPTPPLPIAPRGDTGVTPDTIPAAQVVQNRSPVGGAAGPTPLFEEGKKLFSQHQQEASAVLAKTQPAVDALQLMKTPGILSGPGTEGFTKLVAGLKNIGFINTAVENDPTAVQQEIIKKLHQYVSGNPIAQRSDAAQTLSEASSPSPNVQILPALIRLTKDAIAYDRVKAAMPTAFTKNENGKDVRNGNYAEYGDHIARFPQSVDKRAFILNFEDDDGEKLVKDMAEKEQSKKPKDQAEAAKFFKSLRIAKKQGYYD